MALLAYIHIIRKVEFVQFVSIVSEMFVQFTFLDKQSFDVHHEVAPGCYNQPLHSFTGAGVVSNQLLYINRLFVIRGPTVLLRG